MAWSVYLVPLISAWQEALKDCLQSLPPHYLWFYITTHTPLNRLFSKSMSPSLLLFVYRTCSIPIWLYLPAISVALLFLQNICLRRRHQHNQDVSHFTSIMTFFLLFSRSSLIITKILDMPLWPLLSIVLSFSEKTIPRYLLRAASKFRTRFYVFKIKTDFPRVHHITFINSEYLLVWKGCYHSLCTKII